MGQKLYVGNINFATTEAELESFFANAGTVKSVKIIMDRYSGKSRGFGFVEMETQEAAQKAMEELNGAELGGKNLIVNEAREREDRGGGGGGGGRPPRNRY